VRTGSRRDASFDPTWTIMDVMEAGREGKRTQSLSVMTGTVAPRRVCVIALKKRISLVIESPMINMVGGKRGHGDEDCGLVIWAGEVVTGLGRGLFVWC